MHRLKFLRASAARAGILLMLISAAACGGDDESEPIDAGGGVGGRIKRDAASDSTTDVGNDIRNDQSSFSDSASDGSRDGAADAETRRDGGDAGDGSRAVDAGPEASVDANRQDAGRLVDAEAGVADVNADAPRADAAPVGSDAAADVSLTDADAAAILGDARVDGQPGDAAMGADTSRDVGPDTGADARAADGSSGDACSPNATCLACENQLCPERIGRCDALAGEAQSKCRAVVQCLRATGCHTDNTLDCYCGTADATQCYATSGAIVANGACKAQIEAAQGSTDPTAIQNGYNDLTGPLGAAMDLMICDVACGEACIPYGQTCL